MIAAGGPCRDPRSRNPVTDRVAIAGSGSIGVAFGVLFANAGFEVRLWDAFPDALERARRDLENRFDALDGHGLMLRPVAEALAAISYHAGLEDAVAGTALVQECIPEKLDLKRELFNRLGDLAPEDAILASSTSAIVPGAIAEKLDCGDRIIVGHPGNPPYLIPVIEIVPSAVTAAPVIEAATQLYVRAGLKPINVLKEAEGFVFNRLQGALLREAYCLVRDGIASVDDVDEVVRSGLGLRWSVIGPFETADLNTRGGIASHAEKMGPAYLRMGQERGQNDPWTKDLVTSVAAQRRSLLPLEDWDERVRWRDQQLMKLRANDTKPKN
jgi:3-hydroxyacyl-CoA dehydrogenase